MTAARVAILGAGFAGLSAARVFKKHGNLFDVMVIDRNENTHFRPLIPDVVSRTVHSRHLVYPISAYADRFGFTFVHAHVSGIDFDAHRIAIVCSKYIPFVRFHQSSRYFRRPYTNRYFRIKGRPMRLVSRHSIFVAIF